MILDVAKKKPISLQRLRGHDDEIHCICWAPLVRQETLDKGLYTLRQKNCHYTFVHNFDYCWPIFKILSLLYFPRNL